MPWRPTAAPARRSAADPGWGELGWDELDWNDSGWDNLEPPYHRGLAADRADLVPGRPVELAIELFPTSTLFPAGHCLRLTVTGADRANARTPERRPPPRLTVWREPGRASYLGLPVIPAAGGGPV